MQIDGWVEYKGSDITTKITKGSSPKWQGFDYQNDGTLFVTSENVRNGFLDISSPKYLPLEFNKKLKNSQLEVGDILINIVGASIGRSCQFNIDNQLANINQAVCLFRTNELADRNYIQQYLQLPSTINRLLGTQTESARPNLSLSDLREFTFILPPKNEQKKIAEILSTWDKAIETVEKLVANSQQQKKALMQQLLTGQKRLLDENGVKFGSEWEVIPIASTFKLITDYVASGSFASLKDNVNVSDDEGFAHYVRQTDLAAKFKNTNLKWVDENSYKYLSKSNLYEGDILFTNIGDLGRVYYMPKLEKPATVAPNLVVLRTNEKNNSKFIFYLLESDVGQQEINKIKSGTGLPKISKTEFKTMAFSIPALEEQEKIAQVLTLADREIDLYQQQLDKLKLEKKSLMQQLLTGQKRVKLDS